MAVEPAVMAAAALLFFVYLGFEEVANLAEEVGDPGRHIPLALFISLAVTTALYVAVSFAITVLASPANSQPVRPRWRGYSEGLAWR